MKSTLKLLRGEVFATVFVFYPPGVNPVGIIFRYNEKVYKIIDAIFTAIDVQSEVRRTEEVAAELIVAEMPNL